MALDRILHGGLPCRTLPEAVAARHGVKLRFYATIQDGSGDYDEEPIWANDAADALRQAGACVATMFKNWPRRLVGVSATWDAALFQTGETMLRAEFERWADAVTREPDIAVLIGAQAAE